MSILHCGDRLFDLTRPQVMGILNVTPDSFSDGGEHHGLDAALRHAELMIAQGATVIDIGGESTRPNAPVVSVSEELDRVVPVIERVSDAFDVLVSVDTSKAGVITEGVNAGAGLINDVRALSLPGALEAAAATDAAVCLMHMKGQPKNMQDQPLYTDVVAEVRDYLLSRHRLCVEAGIGVERQLFDPGFGFGKTLEHNLQLVANLEKFAVDGVPVLFGASRKSTIGTLLNDAPVLERVIGSVAMALLAVERGARIVRVHDVKETVEALKMFNAVNDLPLDD